MEMRLRELGKETFPAMVANTWWLFGNQTCMGSIKQCDVNHDNEL